jgi:hypothetical protein
MFGCRVILISRPNESPASQWLHDLDRRRQWPAPTGDYEWGATYTTQKRGSANATNLELRAYLAALRATSQTGAKAGRVVTMLPAPVFFGEGAPLYAGGLGTVSLSPVPSYLLQAGSGKHPEKLKLRHDHQPIGRSAGGGLLSQR